MKFIYIKRIILICLIFLNNKSSIFVRVYQPSQHVTLSQLLTPLFNQIIDSGPIINIQEKFKSQEIEKIIEL